MRCWHAKEHPRNILSRSNKRQLDKSIVFNSDVDIFSYNEIFIYGCTYNASKSIQKSQTSLVSVEPKRKVNMVKQYVVGLCNIMAVSTKERQESKGDSVRSVAGQR